VNSFLNLRVADIWSGYRQWLNKGAFFLSERLDNHGWEWRCYIRDPDGYLIEVGQYTQMALDRFKTMSVDCQAASLTSSRVTGNMPAPKLPGSLTWSAAQPNINRTWWSLLSR
jgi:hypothetical protein